MSEHTAEDMIDPDTPMCACGHTRSSHSPRGCLACAGPPCDLPKNERWPCPTDDCPGDVRYAAPRFRHLATCGHLRDDMERKS